MKNADHIIIKKDDKEIECETLFMFNCPDNAKTYIGFTDGIINKSGTQKIYIKAFNPLFSKSKLEDITKQEEIMVYTSLDKIKDS